MKIFRQEKKERHLRVLLISNNYKSDGQFFPSDLDVQHINPSKAISGYDVNSEFDIVFIEFLSNEEFSFMLDIIINKMPSAPMVAICRELQNCKSIVDARADEIVVFDKPDPGALGLLVNTVLEKKALQLKLQRRVWSLDFAQEIGKFGSWTWFPDTNDFYPSARYYELFGLSKKPNTITHQIFFEKIDRDDQQRVIDQSIKAVSANLPISIEFRIKTDSGSIKYMLLKGEPNRDPFKKAKKYSGITQDVTALKTAAAIVDKQERFLELTGEIAQVGGWEYDFDNDKLYWTQTTFDIHEVPLTYVPNLQAAVDFYDPDTREGILKKMKASKKSGKPFTYQNKLKTYKGKEIWVEVMATPVKENEHVNRLSGIIQDITKNKQTEEDRRIRAMILDNVADASIATNLQGEIIFWNAAAEALYGYSRSETIGRQLLDFELLTDDGKGKQIIENLRAGQTQSGEFPMQDKSGRRFIVRASNAPVYDENGVMIALLAISHDVSEKYESLKRLTQNEERLRLIFEHSPIGMGLSNLASGVWLDCNPALLDILGYTKSEFLKLTYKDITPKAYLHIDAEQFANRPNNGSFGPYKKVYIKNDGSHVNVVIAGFIMVNHKGVKEVWTNVLDLSEIERKSEDLRRSEERFRNYVENATDIICTTDTVGKVGYISPNVKNLFGFDQDELINRSLLDFVHPDDHQNVIDDYKNVIDMIDQPVRVTHRFQHKNGNYIWMQADGRMRRSETGELYLLMMARNIDKQREAEIKIQEQNNKLKDIAFVQSHILRRPLANILGLLSTQALTEDLGKEALRYMELIKKESEIMDLIVSHIVEKSTEITSEK